MISCAMRRATSCHAADFCARNISVRSSRTSTNPALARRGPSELTVTAACRTRPATTVSISRETTPMRSERRISCWTVLAASAPRSSSSECTSRAASPNMRVTAVLPRTIAPLVSSDRTLVGMLSRTVSISCRRRSSSMTACCKLRVNWSICERLSRNCVVIALKERTKTPSSSCACSGTW